MNPKKRALRAVAASLHAQGCNCDPDISLERGVVEIRHDEWCALLKRRGDSWDMLIDFNKDEQEH